MTLIKDPLSPENAEKLEESAKDVSKAALVHHTAMQQDEIKIIIEERDLLYKENEIYNDSLERVLEENKNLRTDRINYLLSKFELENLKDWRDLVDLIPENYNEDSQKKRTGLSGIFAASLELTKEGNIKMLQEKIFDKIMIKKNINLWKIKIRII